MIRTVYTHTGKIYVDHEKKLEFLTVGDYGKENNKYDLEVVAVWFLMKIQNKF